MKCTWPIKCQSDLFGRLFYCDDCGWLVGRMLIVIELLLFETGPVIIGMCSPDEFDYNNGIFTTVEVPHNILWPIEPVGMIKGM